jgi:hypothetical protein
MPDLADLYPGFASHWIDTSAGRIFARSGGEGPPLLRCTAIRRPTSCVRLPTLRGFGFARYGSFESFGENRPHITTSSRGGKSREKILNIGCQTKKSAEKELTS